MTSFSFQSARQVISEPGSSARLGAMLSGLGVRRALVVTDAGVRAAGLPDAALDSLASGGIVATVFDGVVADPPAHVVSEAVEAARSASADGVVGFGGGSSMDVAKLVAFLARPGQDQRLGDIYGIEACRGARLPLVQVPTTAGTGSEVTPIAIVTTGENEKQGVVSPQLLPDLALLDADLTLGLPRPVTAATGIDAMVHAIEAYTSRHRKNPVSDALAREALRHLGRAIRTACSAPDDRTARTDMLFGAMLAGMAFANAPVAAVHALAYPVGGRFHVPHGLSNALLLPHVLRFNAEVAAPLYAELAPLVFPDIDAGAAPVMAAAFVERLEALIAEIGLERRLGQVGISHNHVPMLAEDAMRQTRLLVNNPREVAYADAVRIYEAAL